MMITSLLLSLVSMQPYYSFQNLQVKHAELIPDQPVQESLSITLQEGEMRAYNVKIGNPQAHVCTWSIDFDPAIDWLCFSALSGQLNPGEKSEIKLAVTAARCDSFRTSIVMKYSSLLVKDRLIALKVLVKPHSLPQSLFVISSSRLKKFYRDSGAIVITRLKQFIGHPDVRGIILDVDSSSAVRHAFQLWDRDSNWASHSIANRAVNEIDRYLETRLRDYPTIRFIILIGDDPLIPYLRLPDQSTESFQEKNYAEHKPGYTFGAAVDSNVFLTDDVYADLEEEFNYSYFSMPYEYVVSRLVKSPTQIIRQLQVFLEQGPEIPMRDIFVSSGDYSDSTASFDLKDVADSVVHIYRRNFGSGNVFDRLIQNREAFANYDRQTFSSVFFRRKFDLYSINNHAWHTGFFMPQHVMLKVTDLASEWPSNNRAIIHTVGCHTGMGSSNPTEYEWDFPSVFSQKGIVAYIANTAYSIGSGLGIYYSERLQVNIATRLARGECVGEALRNAKHDYWQNRVRAIPNPYDDVKVVLPITLFGLPFYRCVNYDYCFDVAQASTANQFSFKDPE